MSSSLYKIINIFIILLIIINSISAIVSVSLQEDSITSFIDTRYHSSLYSNIHSFLFNNKSKRLRRTSAISISSSSSNSIDSDSSNQVFEYSSVHAADVEDEDLPTATHTYITSDPTVHKTLGQTLEDEKENEHNEMVTIKEEKQEVKEEMKIIKQEEKNLKIQKQMNEKNKNEDLSDKQLADIALEQLHARAGEEELLDRWMQAPSYAPVLSITQMEENTIGGFGDDSKKKHSGANSREAVDRVKQLMNVKPPPGKQELSILKDKYPGSHTFIYEYYRLWDKVQNVTYGRKIPPNKYYLSLIAMFKNEALGMKEWLDHHIAHGVDHFYLVDDGSTDNPMAVLAPYVDSGTVSMFPTIPKNVPFRQAGLYKKLFTEVYAANESRWIAFLDMDEYLYSPMQVDVRAILRQHEDLSVVGLNWVMFGSSGLVTQPSSIVQSFVNRADYNSSKYPALVEHYKILQWNKGHYSDWQKYIVNTKYKVDNIDVHVVTIEGTAENLSYKRYPDTPSLLLNHYIVQSQDFFLKVKSTRGDVNNFVMDDVKYMDWFKMCDVNDVRDTRLADQNKLLINK